MRLALSFLAAILLPVALLTGWYLYGQLTTFEHGDPYIWIRTRGFFLACLSVATLHVAVLGVPAYLILRRLNAVRWWSTLGMGLVLGAVPVAILDWPLRYPQLRTSASVDGVQTMIDGVPTLAGWLQYASGVFFMGGCGAAGALAFWLVWQMSPNNRWRVP
jgi:hypothetical protein